MVAHRLDSRINQIGGGPDSTEGVESFLADEGSAATFRSCLTRSRAGLQGLRVPRGASTKSSG